MSSAMSSVPESQPFSGSILNHWDIPSKCAAHTFSPPRLLECLLKCFSFFVLFAATLPNTDRLRHPILHVRDSEGQFFMVQIQEIGFLTPCNVLKCCTFLLV